MGPQLAFGFVGAGEIAVASAEALAGARHARLARVYDPQADLAADLAARYGGAPADSIEALLTDPQVAAVYICTPHHLHRPIATQAAAAGKHVFVEKPLGASPADAEAIIAACQQAGVACGVPFVVRYAPAYQHAHELVKAGAIGTITGFRLTYRGDKPRSYWSGGYSGRATSDWRQRRASAGGGVLIMNIVHDLDAVLWITGLEVERVQGLIAGGDSSGDVEDRALAMLSCRAGALGSVEALASLPGGQAPGTRWVNRVYGSTGQIALPSPWSRDPLALFTRESGKWHEQALAAGAAGARQLAFDDFAAAVLAGAPVPVPGEAALRASRVIHAIYASAEQGGPVAPASR